jgi:hypothetical protein
VEGGLDEVTWNGSETSFFGSIKMPVREHGPAAGLLLLRRPSRLRPSFRHLATIGFEPLDLEQNRFAFATIKGCWYGSSNVNEDVPKLLDLYKKGDLKLDELISREISLDGVNDAFAAMEAGEVARSVIVF